MSTQGEARFSNRLTWARPSLPAHDRFPRVVKRLRPIAGAALHRPGPRYAVGLGQAAEHPAAAFDDTLGHNLVRVDGVGRPEVALSYQLVRRPFRAIQRSLSQGVHVDQLVLDQPVAHHLLDIFPVVAHAGVGEPCRQRHHVRNGAPLAPALFGPVGEPADLRQPVVPAELIAFTHEVEDVRVARHAPVLQQATQQAKMAVEVPHEVPVLGTVQGRVLTGHPPELLFQHKARQPGGSIQDAVCPCSSHTSVRAPRICPPWYMNIEPSAPIASTSGSLVSRQPLRGRLKASPIRPSG